MEQKFDVAETAPQTHPLLYYHSFKVTLFYKTNNDYILSLFLCMVKGGCTACMYAVFTLTNRILILW